MQVEVPRDMPVDNWVSLVLILDTSLIQADIDVGELRCRWVILNTWIVYAGQEEQREMGSLREHKLIST